MKVRKININAVDGRAILKKIYDQKRGMTLEELISDINALGGITQWGIDETGDTGILWREKGKNSFLTVTEYLDGRIDGRPCEIER